jgi:hypothetical protein
MTSGPDTPPSASWLHKSFLETALRTGDSAQTLRVTSFDVKPAVGKGENYCSDLYRVRIHTADGRVSNLIVKKELTEDGEFARLIQNTTMFLRETHMFRSTAVKLSNILQEYLPGSYRPLVRPLYLTHPLYQWYSTFFLFAFPKYIMSLQLYTLKVVEV